MLAMRLPWKRKDLPADREERAFALTDMVRWGYGGLRGVTPLVSESTIRGIPAIHRAARIRAEALASLRLKVWRGEGVQRTMDTRSWQAKLFAGAPNEYCTRFNFWETIGESLAFRNNAYIWKNTDPLSGRVISLHALHPDQVARKDDLWEITVRQGFEDPVGRGMATYRVGPETLLHIRGHGEGGMWEAPSPIQVFREALDAPIARQRHETRMWRKGATHQVAVVFPQGVTKEQADPWKEAWRNEYTGTEGETTPMIGGGADIKPIGMTQADAAYVEMAKLTVHDAARIMGVPANLLGAQTEQSVPNLEQDLALWLRTGLGPELGRIESALEADLELFGPRATLSPAFDTEGFVRGDVQTEATILVSLVQAGILTPDEGRALRGLPPLPNGVGGIPQITPVGGAPNPSPAPAMNGNGNGSSANE